MFQITTKEGSMVKIEAKLIGFLFHAILVSILLPLVSSSQENQKIISIHSSNKDNNLQMNPRLQSQVTLHGFLLWASAGFLMPFGILVIRLSNGENNGRRLKIMFYTHAVLQMLCVLLSTVAAIMSIKNFNNSFNNNHQRLGLALYAIIWLQVPVGIFRPRRGSLKRSAWFFSHWIFGTVVSFLGVLNVYTGLLAYHEKTSKSTRIWNILFTVQVSLFVFFYLFQDKWLYIQKQGVLLTPNCQEIGGDDKHKELKAVEKDEIMT